ncbi:MAG: hypothetical protein V1663_00745 [archaeon]
MKKIFGEETFLLILLFTVLIIIGCSTQPSTQPICDDNNTCTQDLFDKNTKTCNNTLIDNCCGNDICEIGDDLKCPKDCSVEGVSGFSVIVPSEIKIKPDGYLYIKIKNTGENPVTITDYSMPNFMQNLNFFTLMPGEISNESYRIGPLGEVGDSFYVRFGIYYIDLITSKSEVSEGTFSGTIQEEIIGRIFMAM